MNPEATAVKGPTGRIINFDPRRYLTLLACRHWFQFTDAKRGLLLCPRCRATRTVVASFRADGES